jgi:superfamily I DNA and RNA helicase
MQDNEQPPTSNMASTIPNEVHIVDEGRFVWTPISAARGNGFTFVMVRSKDEVVKPHLAETRTTSFNNDKKR